MEAEPKLIVYDTGHNPGAWEYLGPELERMPRPLAIICGFAADKDVDSILRKMPADATYYFCKPSGNRGLDADELRRKAAHLSGHSCTDVKAALAEARTTTASSIFIGGSNFLIADLLKD